MACGSEVRGNDVLAVGCVVYFLVPRTVWPRPNLVLTEEIFDLVAGTLNNARFVQRLSCVALCVIAVGGCAITRSRTVWRPPILATPDADAIGNLPLLAAEDSYLAGVQQEAKGCADCVDHYCRAARRAWPAIENELATAGRATPRSADLYRSALAKLLTTGQRFGRWMPGRGLEVSTASGPAVLPATYHGFAWGPEEFHYLEPVGDCARNDRHPQRETSREHLLQLCLRSKARLER